MLTNICTGLSYQLDSPESVEQRVKLHDAVSFESLDRQGGSMLNQSFSGETWWAFKIISNRKRGWGNPVFGGKFLRPNRHAAWGCPVNDTTFFKKITCKGVDCASRDMVR